MVGGGVVGAACAHFLQQLGCSVTIVERGSFGMGCSHANCGFVCPSHVLPLAIPGAPWSAFKALLTPGGPFSIKPRLDPALWSWLWNFRRRCNTTDMMQGAQAIQALLQSSRSLYDSLFSNEPLDCEWQTSGMLFVFRTQAGMDHYGDTIRLGRDSFGLDAVEFTAQQLEEREPALKPGMAGGWLYTGDAHLRPDRLMESWRSLLESRGVVIREDCDVSGFKGDGQAEALVTSHGEMSADSFVIATGAWLPFLEKQLGCRIPIQPGKGYSITMSRPSLCPKTPLMFEEDRVAVTPMQSGYRLGSMMEFAGYDTTLKQRRLDYLKRVAGEYLHEPLGEAVQEEWYGWRPMTYDSLPIIDRCPRFANVILAAGHNMLGLSMAPATGKLVSEILAESTPHVDLQPYRISRFS